MSFPPRLMFLLIHCAGQLLECVIVESVCCDALFLIFFFCVLHQVLWKSALRTRALCLPVPRALPLHGPRVQLPGEQQRVQQSSGAAELHELLKGSKKIPYLALCLQPVFVSWAFLMLVADEEAVNHKNT